MISPVRRALNRSKDLLFVPPLENIWLRRLGGKVMSLVYHRVDMPGRHEFLDRGGSPVIRPEELMADIAFLKSHGAVFLTYDDIRAGKFPSASQFGVIVTFDDCFRCNYEQGLETLGRLGIRAVFFQTTGMIGAEKLIPEHAFFRVAWALGDSGLAEVLRSQGLAAPAGYRDLLHMATRKLPLESLMALLERARPALGGERDIALAIYPTPDLVRAAFRMGHEIGSHGHLHLHRDTVGTLEFMADMATSITEIEKVTGRKPASMSLPYGCYRESDVAELSKFFSNVATCERSPLTRQAVPYAMGRFSWPGPARSTLRWRRWLTTGGI